MGFFQYRTETTSSLEGAVARGVAIFDTVFSKKRRNGIGLAMEIGK